MLPRLAVRAAILHQGRVLVVNAWPDHRSDLWCLPGGGVEPGQSLPETLVREVAEETGLQVAPGPPFLINEFQDPASGFHQVEIHFRATLKGPDLITLADPEGIVNRARWVTQADLVRLRHKPDSLSTAIWSGGDAHYDPLELLMS